MNRLRIFLALAASTSFVIGQAPGTSIPHERRAPSSATVPNPSAFPPAVVPIHTQADDPEGGAYGTWAAGADYKVSFHDGVTVVPFLGPDYPHNQPFTWHTESVRWGELELATSQPTGRQASDVRYEYDLGNVVEAYDVGLDGVEQTFVIPERPAASGDLVVRGRIETQLVCPQRSAAHAPLIFHDVQGRAILDYGSATAVDAHGVRWPMTTAFAEGTVTLRLDQQSLAGATFPLVVDPLIGPNVTLNTNAAFNGTARHFDVVRSGGNSGLNVWVCYTRYASASDEDLWLRRTDDSLPGSLIVQAFTDITTTWTTRTCQLARVDSRVVCAFTRHFSTTTNVRWHAHHVDNLGSDNSVGFWSASNNNWRVDIGGEASSLFLVFQHEPLATFGASPTSQIRGFYLGNFGSGTTSQGTTSSEFVIADSINVDYERPHVARTAESTSPGWAWPVVYQAYLNGATGVDDWDLGCELYDDNGIELDSLWIEPANGVHKLGPDIAGTSGRYVVSYSTADTNLVNFKTTTKVGYNIRSQRVLSNGQSLSLPAAPSTIFGGSTREYEVGGIAYERTSTNDGRWLLVSRGGDAVWADLLGYLGRSVQYELFYNGGGAIEYGGAVDWNALDDNFVLVGSMSGTNNPLFGNIWEYDPLPPVTHAGTTCSSASLSWWKPFIPPLLPWLEGSRRIGTRGSGVVVSGGPTNSLAVLGLSLATANVPLPAGGAFGSGCRLLIDSGPANFLGLADPRILDSTGTTFWSIPLPETLQSLDLHFQVLHLESTNTLLLSTQRMTVPIDY